MDRRHSLLAAASGWLAAAPATATPASRPRETLAAEVTAAELRFADTMARRDHASFMAHVADDAVFLNGGKPLRGKAAIGA